jgi:multidrug efflux system membrane fusion protein
MKVRARRQRSLTARRRGFDLARLAALALLLGGCGEDNTYVPPPPPTVTVSQPTQRTVTDFIELTGNTQSSNSVDLVARVEGYLQSVNFTDGSFVKKGDLLFVIEPEPYQANVELAQATVAQQQATLTQATSEYQRQQRLIQQNATSQSEVENWEAQRDAAQAAVKEANANLELARINLGYTRIAAPFDGRIGAHQVDPGNLVGAGAPTELATIEQLAPIYVYFNVDEQDVLRIRANLRSTGKTLADVEPVKLGIGLQSEAGYPHEATLDFVASDVDQSTGTLQARGTIPNRDYVFLPGMFVRVRVPIGTIDNALLVPDRALAIDQRGHYLLVVNQDDAVEQRPVQIGALVEGMRVIVSGVSAGDWVVVAGIQQAIPGSKVAAKRVEPALVAPEAVTVGGESAGDDAESTPAPPADDDRPADTPGPQPAQTGTGAAPATRP